MNRKTRLVSFTIAAIVSVASTISQAQTVSTHHLHGAVQRGEARVVGKLPATQIMSLNIVLPLKDQAGLLNFLSDVFDPSSASFHQFITPAEFTARFGPTQDAYDAVVRYAQLNGFAIIGGSRDGMNVEIKGPVSAVETAFHVHMLTYQHPSENRVFYSPDSEPTTDLAISLWHISVFEQLLDPSSLARQKI